mgnify:CR=1 FL=1
MTLYFDIETAPDREREHLFDLPPLPDPPPAAPASAEIPPAELLAKPLTDIESHLEGRTWRPAYLDDVLRQEIDAPQKTTTGKSRGPRKGVADAVAAARGTAQQYADLLRERRKKLSVTPEFCRVVALGWAVNVEAPQSLVASPPGEDDEFGSGATEREILEKFWGLQQVERPLVGFNCLNFDLPVLMTRSILLGIKPPCRTINLDKFTGDVIDLMLKRFPFGPAMRLKSLAKCLGIEIPAGDTDGGDVCELWISDPAKLGEYVRSDIEITRALHRKYQHFFCK